MIFRSPETSTAHDLPRLFGQQEIFESAESLSIGAHHLRDGVGLTAQQRLRPIVSEGDIMSLDKFQAFVQLPGNFPIAKVHVIPPRIHERTQAFIPTIERKEAKDGE